VAFGRPVAKETAPSTQAGERLYAIGDVHGRYDLLRDLLDRLEEHSAALPPAASTHVILLGDLVDRGPDSASVLRFLYNSQQRTDRLVVLLGNHEELMLRALDGEKGMLRAWMRVGGRETMKSFGVTPPTKEESSAVATQQLIEAIPAEWVEWMRGFPLTAKSGDYMFCHAGIRPGIALRRQARADLLWIRDEFLLDDESDHGAMIIHGHSISHEVEMRSNRIGIDTGAFSSGVLTALYLEGERREIISTNGIAMEPLDPAYESSASRPD
jgi:serine/threonine protein phosphatase 1